MWDLIVSVPGHCLSFYLVNVVLKILGYSFAFERHFKACLLEIFAKLVWHTKEICNEYQSSADCLSLFVI